MKKIIIATLLMSSSIAFAKTDEPKSKTDLSKKEEKALVVKKNVREEKAEKKIVLKIKRTPFSDCVLNNSISMWAMYYTMGIAVDGEIVEAAATAQCMVDFGLFP